MYVRGELPLDDAYKRITGLYTQILLTIECAENLPKLEKGQVSLPDPYVTVGFADQRFQTRAVPQTFDPVWGQQYRLIVKDTSGDILLTVYDWDPEGKDDPIGICKVCHIP
jgi:Ca2+-dependent lipid-binding protein